MGEVTYIDPRRKQALNVSEQVSDVIHCLMISLSEEAILLPNTAVAEVIGYIEPDLLTGSPDWMLGRITWRERLVPLLSFGIASAASEASPERRQGDRIAILNTMNGNKDIPYIGIVSQGIPRLSVIRKDDISTLETKPENRQSVAEIVSVDGQAFIIPDIDDLETRLQNIQK